MKLLKLTKSLIVEASAKDVLVNKLKLSDTVADFFVEKCGKLAIIMANKIIKSENKALNLLDMNDVFSASESLDKTYKNYADKLSSIMDWIRVALNGNLGQHKNDDFETLYDESVKWHDELEVGGGEYNYDEENDVILDFRDSDGIGFYWVDLNTSRCGEEQLRMGHCASTRGDTLYSLRETKRINDKFTLSKSHLTAAISRYSVGDKILQLKGQKNSKPAEKYHKYIVELLINPDVNIIGFGSEYQTESDFKINDLNEELLLKVIKGNPKLLDIFTRYKLYEEGLIDEKPNTIFDIKIDIHHYKYFFNNYDKYDEKFLENVFSYHIDVDPPSWKDFIYYTNSNLDEKIEEYVNKLYISKNDMDDDFENSSLVEKIRALDDSGGDLIDALHDALYTAAESAYYDGVYNYLKDKFEHYGKVIALNEDNIVMHIDILHHPEVKDLPEFSSYGDKFADLFFDAATEDYLDKPYFNIERVNIGISRKTFDELFYDTCSERDIPITK